MFYSAASGYAVRALTYLALQPKDKERALVRDIAEIAELPQHFLGKVLQDLARAGVLKSWKGPGGGFSLARPAKDITLYDIAEALGETTELNRCAVGFAECSDARPCTLHEQWKSVRQHLKDYLQRTTLQQLAQAVQRKRALLAESD